jgi:hypothetical protein
LCKPKEGERREYQAVTRFVWEEISLGENTVVSWKNFKKII